MKTRTAAIFAAGPGVRLDRSDSPKPLVKVGNKPLILWNIEQLQDAGVEVIYVFVGYRGDEIKSALIANPAITAQLVFIEQTDISKAGIVHSLRKLTELLSESFYLTMADLVLEQNPYQLFEVAGLEDQGAVRVLVSKDRMRFERSGALSQISVEEDRITAVGRTLSSYNALEPGIYHFSSNAVKLLAAELNAHSKAGSFNDVLAGLAQSGNLTAVELPACEWFDVNTPATLIRAELMVRTSYASGGAGRKGEKQYALKPDTTFHRVKKLDTEIVIETAIVDRLKEVEVIPASAVSSPHFLLTDSVVDPLHGERVLKNLSAAGYDVRKLVIPAGEASKSSKVYLQLADDIFTQGMDKGSFIISLGGGVVNNMAGFLASTLYRGIGLIHFPSTMMAQVDAAIDFKQAINSAKGKNLLGSYYPATRIVIDPDILSTLDDRNVRNGFAEAIKHALVQDEEFVSLLKEHAGRFREPAFLEEVIRRTITLKVPLLNGDVHEDRNEMLPQYGHAVGHALEHLSSYDLLHGEALSIGMCVSAEIGRLLKLADDDTVEAHYDILAAYQLPTIVPESMHEDDVLSAIRFDKHFLHGMVHTSIPMRVGEVFQEKGIFGIPIQEEILKKAIRANKERL